MLLFPEPFGPETVVNPFSKGISDLFANDLKLSISSCFIYIFFLFSHVPFTIRQYLTCHVKQLRYLLQLL